MKIIIAVILLLHGFAHLVGFALPWHLVSPESGSYRTTILNGQLDVGEGGAKALGIFWLIAAVGFSIAAAGAVAGAWWWPLLTIYVAIFSLALCVLAWPAARIGLPINLVILATLLVGIRIGWPLVNF